MPITADRDEIIQQNMGLVHACAHKFKGRGIEYEDLFQAGCMGLIKATDAFDRERGVRFSTYAVPVILGEMRRLFRDGGTIKVSRTLKELSLKTMRTKERLSVELGREPTISELADSLGLEVLVEVHDREELESVAFLQPQILGVNNRNLKTFEVNLDTVAKLRPYAPENAVFVSESGIRNHADMQMVRQLGADAVLIGETLMRSGNVTETLHQLREGI